MGKKFPYNFLSLDDIGKIKNKISEVEKSSSGEIVLSIKNKRNFFERNKTLLELSQKEFKKARISSTAESTGVLIFIIFSERQFYILPDVSISKVVEKDFWQRLADEMSEKFKANNYVNGIIECIEKIGEVLKSHFPPKPNDKNELSDEIRFS
jgi:uncharacterized membrane protein